MRIPVLPALLICLLSGVVHAQAPVALTNPSFETSTGDTLDGWTEVGGTGGHYQSLSDIAATEGVNVAQLRGLHNTNGNSGISQILPDSFATGTYVLSFDAASRNTANGGVTSIYAGIFQGTPSAANTLASITPLLNGGDLDPAPGLSTYTLELVLPGGDAIGQPIGIQFMNAGPDGVFLPGTVGEGGATNLLFLDNLSLTFTASAGLVPGDADGNGFVEEADFIWLSDRLFTDVEPFTNGDFNGDGQPDFDDFGVWKDAFVALGGDLSQITGLTAPEPSCLALVAWGGLTMFARRRRK